MGRMRTIGGLLVAATISLLLTGCGGEMEGEVAGDKAGGDAAPVILRVGTDDRPGRRGADQIAEFARQVEQLSGGALRIEAVLQAGGDESEYEGEPDDYPGWDQVVARMVVSGELDMGLIPARAWDTEGVSSLRALQAPFLVTSEDLVAEIVMSDLADEMLAGLEPIGVTGIALVPESLRRLLFFGDPPGTPHELGGKYVRAPRSETTYAVLEALGATPDDFAGGPGDRMSQALQAGELVAAESALWLASSLGGMPNTTTHGDVVLFPKVNSLVINTAAFDALISDEQAILREAARGMVAWAVEAMPSDREDAETFCASGGRIVTSGTVARFHDATRPVYDDLERDPATRSLIERIRALADDLDAAATEVPPCEPLVADQDEGSGELTHEGFPEGVYRMEVTVDEMVAAGSNELDARDHAGRWTLRFDDGQLTVEDVSHETGERTVDEGVYCVRDGWVELGIFGDPPVCGDFWRARWELDGDQLRFVDITSGHGSDKLIEVLFGSKPWTKIR